MTSLLAEFEYRRAFVRDMNYGEMRSRLSGFLDWIKSEAEFNPILNQIRCLANVEQLMQAAGHHNPPQASTPEQVVAVGLWLMEKVTGGADVYRVSSEYGIRPSYNTNSLQDLADEVVRRFIDPALDWIERELRRQSDDEQAKLTLLGSNPAEAHPPLEIIDSLKRFYRDHGDYRRNAFIMMRFGTTTAHNQIIAAVRKTLSQYTIEGLRADDKEYHEDLFPNVLTYLYGCRFGIAVFERLEADDFNPNVSLEVGYMKALHKPVCLLKDRTLATLQTDLVGKLYREFDPQHPEDTIPGELEKWLQDKEIVCV